MVIFSRNSLPLRAGQHQRRTDQRLSNRVRDSTTCILRRIHGIAEIIANATNRVAAGTKPKNEADSSKTKHGSATNPVHVDLPFSNLFWLAKKQGKIKAVA
jgi:hypothetical protein